MKKYLPILIVGILVLGGLGGFASTENSVNISASYIGSKENNFTESEILLTVDVPSFEFGTVFDGVETFAKLELRGEGFTTIVGEAKLPVIRYMVEIPMGANPEIFVASVSWEYTSLNKLGLPSRVVSVQPSIPKNEGVSNADFIIDDGYYSNTDFMQIDIAGVVETGYIRGHHYALVEVFPVQYNPSSGELKIMISCELRISLPGSDMIKTSENIKRYSSLAFDDLLKNLFVKQDSNEEDMLSTPKDSESYLIIIYDSYYDEILPFVSWKESMGYEVTVTNTSDIPGGTAKENIYDYIEDAYYNWSTPPSYVLLVGDTGQIPTYTGQSSYTAADLYYVTVNGTDYFPDIFIGRFPAAQEAHVTAMVDKTVYYEQGNFPSNDFIKKAAFMASTDNYQISEGTHNYVINNYLDPNNYTCDKLYTYTYGATTQDVRDALNDGRSLAVFSGHGSTTSWADGPYFSQSDVNGLTNQDMYPFVCSHSCVTGKFTVSECFGETWLRAADKAGLAFWGSSANTLWPEDDVLEKKMFYAWWEDNLETIGGMTDMGLYYLYQYYGGGGNSRYYFECYNVLGDPSVKIWRNVPNPENPPEISNVQATPVVQDSDGWVNISCDVSSIVGILQVKANVTYPDGTFLNQTLLSIAGTDSYYCNTTYSVLGTYNFIIWAEDINNDQNISNVHYFHIGPDVVDILLTTGWNQITIPVENDFTASSLGDSITDCAQVSYWNNTLDAYQDWIVGWSEPEDDYPIEDGRSYFVYVNIDSVLQVSGQPVLSVSVPLGIGWNMIGWYKEDSTMASSIGDNVTGCLQVSYWNNTLGAYQDWIVGWSEPEDDYPINCGVGFFVYTDEASVWLGEG